MNDLGAVFGRRPALLLVVAGLALGFAFVHQRQTKPAAPPAVINPPPMGQVGAPPPGDAFATTSELQAQRAAIEAWVNAQYGPPAAGPTDPGAGD